MNISTRHLEAFVTLAETHSFTRAAKACHLSQPAFSVLIKALEDELRVRLFERSTRRVELTQEGALFLESTRRVLRDLRFSVNEMHDYAERRKGKVAIAALPSLAAGWLPQMLAEFRRLHPGVEIMLYDRLHATAIELLRRGGVDFALTSHDGEEGDLVMDHLFLDRFHFVCRRDHPLAARKSIRLRELNGQPLIHFSLGSSIRSRIEHVLGPVSATLGFEVQYLSTVAGLVRSGLGVSIVPTMALFQFEHPEIAMPLIKDDDLVRPLVMLRRARETLSPAPEAFRRVALEMVRGLG